MLIWNWKWKVMQTWQIRVFNNVNNCVPNQKWHWDCTARQVKSWPSYDWIGIDWIKFFSKDDRRKRKNIPRTLSAAHRFDYVRPCAHGWSQFSFFFSGRNLELFLAWIKLHFTTRVELWKFYSTDWVILTFKFF